MDVDHALNGSSKELSAESTARLSLLVATGGFLQWRTNHIQEVMEIGKRTGAKSGPAEKVFDMRIENIGSHRLFSSNSSGVGSPRQEFCPQPAPGQMSGQAGQPPQHSKS